MDENSKSTQRKNRSMRHLPGDDQQQHHEQQKKQQQNQYRLNDFHHIIPVSIQPTLPSACVLPKRRRCSITNDSMTTATNVENDFMYERPSILSMSVRKRSAQDDIATTSNQHFLRDQHHSNKRPRYEYSRSIELENQPPRSSISSQASPFFYHPPENNRRSSTWANLPIQNDGPTFLQDLSLPLSRTTTTTATPSNSFHEHDSLSLRYSSLIDEDHRSLRHASSIFTTNPMQASIHKSTDDKNQMRLLSTQSNENCPLRTPNFLLDNKQQQILLRTGNVSPAHSDSSSESTSTCSSDEQSHHTFGAFCSQNCHHLQQQQQQQQNLIAQAQPWRTYRERENYEQLIDLAEKLSDPNRFKQVDIQQFFSYRYKADPITSEVPSKQTACVICMSHFKNGQRIRVLPCQHEYHSKCIARWFTMNSSCPICRRDNFFSLT